MIMSHRLLILAPDPLIRAGITALLAEEDGIEIAGVGEPQEAREDIDDLIDLFRPTAVVWDVGWDQEDQPVSEWGDSDLPLIVLLPSSAAADRWLQAGASGVLTRQITASQVSAALDAAQNQLVTIAPDFAVRVARSPVRSATVTESLTQREFEILQLIAAGLTNKAIAAALEISPHTVKFHVTGVLSKLGVQSRTEAVGAAVQLGLLSF